MAFEHFKLNQYIRSVVDMLLVNCNFRYVLVFFMFLGLGFSYVFLEGSPASSKAILKEGNTERILNISVCDYIYLPKNLTLGRSKDIFIIDICSYERPMYIDQFIFKNLPIHHDKEIYGIIYYPYVPENLHGSLNIGYPVKDFSFKDDVLEIIGPYKVYPSNHSNVFLIVLDDSPRASMFEPVGFIMVSLGILSALAVWWWRNGE